MADKYAGPERRGTLNGIEKSTFAGMPTEDKMMVLFDYHVSMHNMIWQLVNRDCPLQTKKCDERFHALERRKYWNTVASGIGGVIGGFIALVAKWLLNDK